MAETKQVAQDTKQPTAKQVVDIKVVIDNQIANYKQASNEARVDLLEREAAVKEAHDRTIAVQARLEAYQELAAIIKQNENDVDFVVSKE